MAADLAGTPRSGITTQICGDAHLENFGVFRVDPDKKAPLKDEAASKAYLAGSGK